ncbi:hypothetical protein DL762_006100 [Monosporascus cannonballus]|uniref:Uncharacterized protein n=1 Tax=Monosporascus cannonballus TaxID=155416 RepID=A0ABY0H6D8_9PEZI|nr:hypothetical protein DL762_006100 [Monosporascus cannonballus]
MSPTPIRPRTKSRRPREAGPRPSATPRPKQLPGVFQIPSYELPESSLSLSYSLLLLELGTHHGLFLRARNRMSSFCRLACASKRRSMGSEDVHDGDVPALRLRLRRRRCRNRAFVVFLSLPLCRGRRRNSSDRERERERDLPPTRTCGLSGQSGAAVMLPPLLAGGESSVAPWMTVRVMSPSPRFSNETTPAAAAARAVVAASETPCTCVRVMSPSPRLRTVGGAEGGGTERGSGVALRFRLCLRRWAVRWWGGVGDELRVSWGFAEVDGGGDEGAWTEIRGISGDRARGPVARCDDGGRGGVDVAGGGETRAWLWVLLLLLLSPPASSSPDLRSLRRPRRESWRRRLGRRLEPPCLDPCSDPCRGRDLRLPLRLESPAFAGPEVAAVFAAEVFRGFLCAGGEALRGRLRLLPPSLPQGRDVVPFREP